MDTRTKLLRAAENLFLQKGFSATTVDEICRSAGATKGAFFHHFASKEEMGLLTERDHANRRFGAMRRVADAPTNDPIRRVYEYVEHVATLATEAKQPACLVAAMTLELAAVNPKFQAQCDEDFTAWTNELSGLLDDALDTIEPRPRVSSRELAQLFIAIFEGSLVLARAHNDNAIIVRNIAGYKGHLEAALGMVREQRPS